MCENSQEEDKGEFYISELQFFLLLDWLLSLTYEDIFHTNDMDDIGD